MLQVFRLVVFHASMVHWEGISFLSICAFCYMWNWIGVVVFHRSVVNCRRETPSALGAIKCMPIMEEFNAEPTMNELSKVIDSLATCKAPGSNSIPPDLLKHCKTTLLHPLHKVLCQCWREGAVLQDMRGAKIITLYKDKGERSDCNNYSGISLLNIICKIYARDLLICLQKLAEHIYLESQCCFWAERSTVDMVFSLHQLQEKCREQWIPCTLHSLTSPRPLTSSAEMASSRLFIRLAVPQDCTA